MSPVRWAPTDCSSILQKRTFSGAPRSGAFSRSLLCLFWYARRLLIPLNLSELERLHRGRHLDETPHLGNCSLMLRSSATDSEHTSRSLSRHALITLVRALVISKVDYCNSVLAGISGHLLDRLQFVLNVATRLIYSANRSDSITLLLCELHSLKVSERIEFRLCFLVYCCLEGSAPSYLAEGIHRTTDNPTCKRLRSADTTTLLVPPSRRSTLGYRSFFVAAACVRGTRSLAHWDPSRHCQHFSTFSEVVSFNRLTKWDLDDHYVYTSSYFIYSAPATISFVKCHSNLDIFNNNNNNNNNNNMKLGLVICWFQGLAHQQAASPLPLSSVCP